MFEPQQYTDEAPKSERRRRRSTKIKKGKGPATVLLDPFPDKGNKAEFAKALAQRIEQNISNALSRTEAQLHQHPAHFAQPGQEASREWHSFLPEMHAPDATPRLTTPRIVPAPHVSTKGPGDEDPHEERASTSHGGMPARLDLAQPDSRPGTQSRKPGTSESGTTLSPRPPPPNSRQGPPGRRPFLPEMRVVVNPPPEAPFTPLSARTSQEAEAQGGQPGGPQAPLSARAAPRRGLERAQSGREHVQQRFPEQIISLHPCHSDPAVTKKAPVFSGAVNRYYLPAAVAEENGLSVSPQEPHLQYGYYDVKVRWDQEDPALDPSAFKMDSGYLRLYWSRRAQEELGASLQEESWYGQFKAGQPVDLDHVAKFVYKLTPRSHLDFKPMFTLTQELLKGLLDRELVHIYDERERTRRECEEKLRQMELQCIETLKELKAALADALSQLAAAQAEIRRLQALAKWSALGQENAQASIDELTARCADLEARIEAYQSRIADLEAENARKDAKIAELEGLLAGKDKKIADLEARLADRDKKIADLEARLAGLQAELAAKDARIAELEGLIEGLNGRIADLEGELAAKDAKIALLLARIAELEAQAQVDAAEIARLRAELERLMQQYKALEAELAKAKEDLKKAIDDLLRAKADLAEALKANEALRARAEAAERALADKGKTPSPAPRDEQMEYWVKWRGMEQLFRRDGALRLCNSHEEFVHLARLGLDLLYTGFGVKAEVTMATTSNESVEGDDGRRRADTAGSQHVEKLEVVVSQLGREQGAALPPEALSQHSAAVEHTALQAAPGTVVVPILPDDNRVWGCVEVVGAEEALAAAREAPPGWGELELVAPREPARGKRGAGPAEDSTVRGMDCVAMLAHGLGRALAAIDEADKNKLVNIMGALDDIKGTHDKELVDAELHGREAVLPAKKRRLTFRATVQSQLIWGNPQLKRSAELAREQEALMKVKKKIEKMMQRPSMRKALKEVAGYRTASFSVATVIIALYVLLGMKDELSMPWQNDAMRFQVPKENVQLVALWKEVQESLNVDLLFTRMISWEPNKTTSAEEQERVDAMQKLLAETPDEDVEPEEVPHSVLIDTAEWCLDEVDVKAATRGSKAVVCIREWVSVCVQLQAVITQGNDLAQLEALSEQKVALEKGDENDPDVAEFFDARV